MATPVTSCQTVSGQRGAVAAAHPAATAAGVRALLDGGSALDAALAAQAVVCALLPNAAGLGGDMLALVRSPDGVVTAVNGTGRSPTTGFPGVPGAHGTPAGVDVTVPGLVDAWAVCHERWARLPLARLLEPATQLARTGSPVGVALAAAVAAQRTRLLAGGAAPWPLLACAVGGRWVQPELADLLERVGEQGPAAFYVGTAAAALTAAVRRAGGRLDEADLANQQAEVGAALTVRWAGGVVHVQPPMSQGVLLAVALAALEDGRVRWSADRADHLLVELTEAAFTLRSECGRGAQLLDRPLEVDEDRASGRGGPRAYLHTASVAAADADGMVVSSLLSVFDDFGSAVYVPELGLVLNNRAAGFTDGDNAPAAGARPVHTLAPALVETADGDLLALATPGADGQVQTLLQVLAAQRFAELTLADAIAAPRWRSEGARLLVERDHPASDGLRARGHRVEPRTPGDDRFGAVAAAGLHRGRPFAVADWRRSMTAGGA